MGGLNPRFLYSPYSVGRVLQFLGPLWYLLLIGCVGFTNEQNKPTLNFETFPVKHKTAKEAVECSISNEVFQAATTIEPYELLRK